MFNPSGLSPIQGRPSRDVQSRGMGVDDLRAMLMQDAASAKQARACRSGNEPERGRAVLVPRPTRYLR